MDQDGVIAMVLIASSTQLRTFKRGCKFRHQVIENQIECVFNIQNEGECLHTDSLQWQFYEKRKVDPTSITGTVISTFNKISSRVECGGYCLRASSCSGFIWSSSDLTCKSISVQTLIGDSTSYAIDVHINKDVKPVNGNWAAWSAWGSCSRLCGGGNQTRSRTCDAPSNAGLRICPSEGSSTDSQSGCNPQTCPPLVLVGGNSYEGNLYTTHPVTGVYGPVCDDSWDLNDANVACRQMGFIRGASDVWCCSFFGAVPSSFSYDDMGCVGNEATLSDCYHVTAHNCGTGEGAGVRCLT